MTKLSIMSSMFENCKKLISINFPKSKAPILYKMDSLFKNCESLISVDLSNFITTNVSYMDNVFLNCKSLTSINLSNFDTSNATWINNMFNGCSKLEYINLQNVKETDKIEKIENVFLNTPENLIICLDREKAPRLMEQLATNKDESCYRIYCGDDWITQQKKLINGSNICIDKYNNSKEYKINNNNQCSDSCYYGYFYTQENIESKNYKCNLDKCLLCSNIIPIKYLCVFCKDSYYPIDNDIINILPYDNCFSELEGYYLDINIYKECYYTCKSCNIGGDNIKHYCSECKDNFNFGLEYEGSLNCYENCTYYHYFDENRNYYCTYDSLCPDEYNKLLPDKRKCIKNCSLDDIYKFEYKNICYSKCPGESKATKENYCEIFCNETNPFVIVETLECKDFCDIELIMSGQCIYKYNKEINENNEEEKREQDIKAQNKLLENIEKSFISETYNTTNVENGKDEVIRTPKMTITLTTTENQKNKSNENINTTTIDLGECEDLLRQFYNISDEQKIYMKKIDVIQDGYKIPYVKYDVYSKLNGSNLVKLNLSVCKDTKVDISIPIILSENLDKLNISSGYYNDICYKSKSDSGTDIILTDRKEEFIDGKMTICQDGCDFTDYDYKYQQAKCSCDIKESSDNYADMNIIQDNLFKNFIDIKNIANINILKCYKSLF